MRKGQFECYFSRKFTINDNIHSPKGIQLAKEIILILMEDEGCAESFPYNIIDELQAEFGIQID